MPRIKVIIADDHPLFLGGLADFLSVVGNIEVIQACKNGAEALKSIKNHKPAVAIIDVLMPELTGLQVLAAARECASETRIVLLTGAPSHQEFQTAMQAGAYAVLTKDTDPERLLAVIHDAARGQKTYPFELLQSAHQEIPPTLIANKFRLSESERKVMSYAAEGLSNKEIARKLNITEGTAKVHLYRIFRKTGARNRTALARLAEAN